MDKYNTRVALITGAGNGIGKCIARNLGINHGAAIAVVDVNTAAASQTASEIQSAGGKAEVFTVDLADIDVLEDALKDIDTRMGEPDVVVNNAGVASIRPAEEHSLSQWQLTLAVNVTAPFLIHQHVIPAMRSKGWGRIVNIASVSGVRAGTGRVGYGTSKAALIGLTRQFAIETAEFGITVNAIAPGPVRTQLAMEGHVGDTANFYHRTIPMGRYGSTDEIAHAVEFLTSDSASYITGATLAVDGGFLAGGLVLKNMFDP